MTMRAMRYGLATAVAAAIGAGAAPAAADEPGPNALPITVVAIQTIDADDQAEALTKAVRNAVRAMPGWSLGEGDYTLEVLTLNLKCPDPPDASCESRMADQIHADRFIWGTLNKEGANVKGELHFWVRGKGSQKIALDYTSNLSDASDEALRAIAADAINRLTGGPPKGTVRIRAVNVPAQVFIDGQPAGALSSGTGTYPLPSGSHTIVLKAPGYADAQASVTIRPNVTSDVAIALVAVEPESKTNWRKVGGFVGLGTGVALGAVGLVSSLQVNAVQNDLRPSTDQVPQGQDACDFAENKPKCDKARTFEVVQLVAYPLAAVAGGVGIYLLATSDWSSGDASRERAKRLKVEPQIGLSSGRLDVTYRF